MPSPLFSTYSQGENRITSSILTVLERVGLCGSQYISAACFRYGARSARGLQSMGAVGSLADNAAAESFDTSLKRETLEGKGLKGWPTSKAARIAVFSWINRYNTRRRHSANR